MNISNTTYFFSISSIFRQRFKISSIEFLRLVSTLTFLALCERSRSYSLEVNMFVVLKRILFTTFSMRVVFVSLTIHWLRRLFLMNVLNICFNVLTCTQKFLAITFSFSLFSIFSKHLDRDVLHALLVSRWRWQFCSITRLVKSRFLSSFFDCCHWRTQWLVVTQRSSSWMQAIELFDFVCLLM